MIGQKTREVELNVTANFQVPGDPPEPLGVKIISRRLKEQGTDLSKQRMRYHLNMYERGLTRQVGYRDGWSITQTGVEELKSASACDKVGFASDRLKLLAYLTNFDLPAQAWHVPIDVSLFAKRDFNRALEVMRGVFEAGICIGNLVAVATEGEGLGDTIVPLGKIGFATVSPAVVGGAMLKSGIPIDFRFGAILQVRNCKPIRFVDLIEYQASTIDPFDIFIAGRMTNTIKAAKSGEGKILASFQEIPLPSKEKAIAVLERLKAVGLCNLITMGKASEPVCEIPVRLNKVGIVLASGLNAVAAAAEAGIHVISKTMDGVVKIEKLRSFWSL